MAGENQNQNPGDGQNPGQNLPGGDGKPAGEQQPQPAWYESSDKLKPHAESLKKFKSPEDVALSYVNLEKSMGGRVKVPGADAKPEDVAAFHKSLGVPDKPEGYGEYVPPKLVDGSDLPWDKQAEGRFYARAHKLGLTPAQAKGVLDLYAEETTTALHTHSASSVVEQENAWEALRGMWGSNTDRNVALAQQAVVTLGDKDFKALLDESGVGNHPAFLKFAAKVGEGLVEDGIIKPDMVGQTADQAKAEITKLMASEPYMKREHPDHNQVIERLAELYRAAYPSI